MCSEVVTALTTSSITFTVGPGADPQLTAASLRAICGLGALSQRMYAANVCEAVLQAFHLHMKDALIVEWACRAVGRKLLSYLLFMLTFKTV